MTISPLIELYRPGYTRRNPDPIHLTDPAVEATRTKTTAQLIARLFSENLDLPMPVDEEYNVRAGGIAFIVEDALAVEQWADRLHATATYTRTARAPQVVRITVEGVARIYGGRTDRYLPVRVDAIVDDPGHILSVEVA